MQPRRLFGSEGSGCPLLLPAPPSVMARAPLRIIITAAEAFSTFRGRGRAGGGSRLRGEDVGAELKPRSDSD
ncbi:hypothetical protein CO651_23080 [Rhizobium phaseoli]|uniref:Uncharacterized protein n=2 Tax=Rhizobium TaxID=379 RepID=A0A2A6J2A2_9HYPH|nr:hypothetical protein CO650_31150 [Rhizobium phaseoli]PDS69654.1 hypothetical protein CO651_23080 [Rhizobium phaseoli]PDT00044.1 hypothetical protein CO666_32735 [Rhizobium chutanense]RUM17477.1 hypothetical protein EFQ99_34300 [Rhizobium vallis]